MKDLYITVCCDSRKVLTSRSFIGLTGENLQGNIIVDFKNEDDFIDGTAYFEVCQNGEKYFIEMTKDAENHTYTLPIKSSLLRYTCKMQCQISIQEAEVEEETPIFKSEIFTMPCVASINAIEEIPDQYPLWKDAVDQEIAELQTGKQNTLTAGAGITIQDDVISAESVIVDTEMSSTSENAVQNKVIKEYVDNSISTSITTALGGDY